MSISPSRVRARCASAIDTVWGRPETGFCTADFGSLRSRPALRAGGCGPVLASLRSGPRASMTRGDVADVATDGRLLDVVTDAYSPTWTPSWPHPVPPWQHGVRYSHAPIVEAILDIRVAGGSADLQDLEDLLQHLPGWEEALRGEVRGLRPNDETGVAEPSDPIAYAFMRSDRRRRIQASPDSLAYAWIGDYQTWDKLVEEFREVWGLFASIVAPQAVTRIGCRFVNVIQIPASVVEISDYLRTRVDVAPSLPQGVSSYFMQIDVPLSDSLGVVVTSAMADPASDQHTGVALDLDTHDDARLELETNAFEPLEQRLITLREVKNYVFEASITDATRNLIR